MPRHAQGRTRLNLNDADTVARLDAVGIPADVAVAFARLDVSVGIVERLAATEVGWDRVRSLLSGLGLRGSADVAALVTLVGGLGMSAAEVDRWARVGELDAALRLHLKGVPVAAVERFPLHGHLLGGFLRMVQATANTGIHVDDLWWWHTAGVLSLEPPYLHESLWASWRSVAVTHLGFRTAALAAAAGLTTDAAVELWRSGEVDTEALTMMAGLRSGDF